MQCTTCEYHTTTEDGVQACTAFIEIESHSQSYLELAENIAQVLKDLASALAKDDRCPRWSIAVDPAAKILKEFKYPSPEPCKIGANLAQNEVICRGSYTLGSACGKCKRCRNELARILKNVARTNKRKLVGD